jgi:hypothetical protein
MRPLWSYGVDAVCGVLSLRHFGQPSGRAFLCPLDEGKPKECSWWRFTRRYGNLFSMMARVGGKRLVFLG